MNDKCYKIKDKIADLVTGLLPQDKIPEINEHLEICPDCREYYQRFQNEEKLLTNLFEKFNDDMQTRRNLVLNAICNTQIPHSGKIISLTRRIDQSTFTRKLAVAAVIAFVTVYFIITLTWITQITECVKIAASL